MSRGRRLVLRLLGMLGGLLASGAVFLLLIFIKDSAHAGVGWVLGLSPVAVVLCLTLLRYWQSERQAAAPRPAVVGRRQAYAQRVRTAVRDAGLLVMTGETVGLVLVLLERVYVGRGLRPLYPLEGGLLRETDLVGRARQPAGPFAVLGGPGSGKSALLRHLTMSTLDARGRASGRLLPVLIVLRRHAWAPLPGQGDLAQVAAREPGLDPTFAKWIGRQLERGRCLVMLDGLDEVPAAGGARAEAVTWMKNQVSKYPGNTFIITSRPHAIESVAMFPVRELELEGLSARQSAEFLDKWHETTFTAASAGASDGDGPAPRAPASRSPDLLARLDGNPTLSALAANPLTLSMIARWDKYRAALPGSRAELYGEVIDVLLNSRWKASGRHRRGASVPSLHPYPGGSAKTAAAVRSLAMHVKRSRKAETSDAEAISALRQTLQRSDGYSDARPLLAEIAETGLIARRHPDQYTFVYPGLQDYLVAAEIRDRSHLLSLLTDNVDDPWWREATVLWAAQSDADPVVTACLASGTAQALSLAAECAEVSPGLSPELRHALAARLRQQRAEERRPSGALIAYIAKAGSAEAAEAAEQPPEPLDAVLLSRAEQARGRLAQSALDLYVASLSARGSLLAPAAGETVSRYLTLALGLPPAAVPSTDAAGNGWLGLLRGRARLDPGAALPALFPLLSEGRALREDVLDAVLADAELAAASAAYLDCQPGAGLRAAWQAAADERGRGRWWLVHGLDLARVDLSESALAGALAEVADYRQRSQPYLHRSLGKITGALTALRESRRAASFEDAEAALRTALHRVTALGEDIRHAPTCIGVEVLLPAAETLRELAEREIEALARACPPRPRLSPALAHATVAHGLLTVQVKVSNEAGSAPLESAELIVQASAPDEAGGTRSRSAALTVQARLTARARKPNEAGSAPPESAGPAAEPDAAGLAPVPAALPHPVRGGTARVALVRLPLAGQVPSGRVDVPVALRYRPRYGPPRQVTESLSFDVLAPASFEEVPNPYLEGASGIPVSSASGMFFGREQIIGRVRERLRKAAGPGTGVAVFGQKRSGKSSIRLRLVDQLRRADGFPVVDIGNIGELTPADSEPDPRRLLATLIWRIIEGAEAERPGSMPFRSPMLRREEFLASPDPVYDCARLFAGYDGARPFVVCIDEFQYIEGWIRDGLIPASFLQLIKALVERRLFHLVIVGQSDLERLVRDDPNVFGVFAAERVSYLEPAEARQLAEVPILLEGASRFRERAADRVIELTGGNAFFVQRLGAELVEYMNAERAPLVTEADVDLVSDAFLDRLTEADFDNLESLGRDGFAPADYRAVLLAIARALRHGRATDEAVAEEYDGERLPEILRDLVSHEVIRRDGGGYRIVVGLYRDWLIKFLGS